MDCTNKSSSLKVFQNFQKLKFLKKYYSLLYHVRHTKRAQQFQSFGKHKILKNHQNSLKTKSDTRNYPISSKYTMSFINSVNRMKDNSKRILKDCILNVDKTEIGNKMQNVGKGKIWKNLHQLNRPYHQAIPSSLIMKRVIQQLTGKTGIKKENADRWHLRPNPSQLP